MSQRKVAIVQLSPRFGEHLRVCSAAREWIYSELPHTLAWEPSCSTSLGKAGAASS